MTNVNLHDATLLDVSLAWESGECRMRFRGGPHHPGDIVLLFSELRELVLPREASWGPSVSVLKLTEPTPGTWLLHMQSGDTICIKAQSAVIGETKSLNLPSVQSNN